VNPTETIVPTQHAEHLKKIDTYYTKAQRFYEWAWDKFGLHYGLWTSGIETRVQAIDNENSFLAERVGVNPGDWVLDAGCGVGGSGIWLAQHKGAQLLR